MKLPTWYKLFGIILILLILSCFVYVYIWNRLLSENSRFSTSVVTTRSLFIRNQSAIAVNHRIQKEYQMRLSIIPQPRFSNKNHVTLGPPIKSQNNSDNKNNAKRVLLWTTFFGIVQWAPITLCEGQSRYCVTSTDKKDLLDSDAILFHPVNLKSFPEQRLPSQRWVYFMMEPPHMVQGYYIDLKKYNGVFNWTSTYRQDSDFPAKYYMCKPRQTALSLSEHKINLSVLMAKKTGLVAAVVSNCDSYNTQRLDFIEKLKNYIQVDFYGFCGQMSCPYHGNECKERLKEYKFFLSFENCNCREYITEKVKNPLNVYQAVPIVMGGAHPADYQKIMPPMSYIHYQGFESVRELADYIIFLDGNPEMYEEYHGWRQTHETVDRPMDKYFCDLCQSLHNDSLPTKVYSDIKGWNEEDVCLTDWRLSI